MVAQTDVGDVVYELLINVTDEGPAPIYLDAQGHVAVHATGSIAGGWAVFANVSMGLHTLSFGHASETLERIPGMGWAGTNSGTTDVWALPNFPILVAAVRRAE